MECGIVGIPNVGKSTLFNALSKKYIADAANYPFCTIEPNIAEVKVIDTRLNKLSQLSSSKKIIYSTIKFVDIAGLIEGASKGEGLGNKFLSNIKEVNGIIHVLRCFDNADIQHVYEKVNPIRDLDIICSELMLADLENLYKQKTRYEKLTRVKCTDEDMAILKSIQENISLLEQSKTINLKNIFNKDRHSLEYISYKFLNLLSAKPSMYVCNVAEEHILTGNVYTATIQKKADEENKEVCLVSAQIEAEISTMDEEDQLSFLSELGLTEPTMNNLIRKVYKMLNCETFFTTGVEETRGWSIQKGSTAVEAAAKIHTDIAKHFICAELLPYSDFIKYGSFAKAKEEGKLQIVGKNHILQDGDVVLFKHGAK